MHDCQKIKNNIQCDESEFKEEKYIKKQEILENLETIEFEHNISIDKKYLSIINETQNSIDEKEKIKMKKLKRRNENTI